MLIGIILFLIHVLLCIACFILRKMNRIFCEYTALVIAFFVPVFGFLILFYQSYIYEKEREAKLDAGLAKMQASELYKRISVPEDEDDDIVPISESIVVNDAGKRRDLMINMLYALNRSIEIEEDELVDKVVPIEDALRLNDSADKRALIMDVLYTNPEDFISQLSMARSNDDVEVVHYAVTALVEIQKEYDVKLQKIIKERKEDPQDQKLIKEYQKLMEQYISSGLLSDSAKRGQLAIYGEFLQEQLEKDADSWSLLVKKGWTDFLIGDGQALQQTAKKILQLWPLKEQGYLMMLESCALLKDREGIDRVMALIREKGIHLSQEARAVIDYWSEGE